MEWLVLARGLCLMNVASRDGAMAHSVFEEFALLLKQESVFAGVAQVAGSDLFSERGARSRLGEAAASPAFSHE